MAFCSSPFDVSIVSQSAEIVKLRVCYHLISRMITQRITAMATGIQKGARTHHQDHAITPHSLRMMKVTPSRVEREMLQEVVLLLFVI